MTANKILKKIKLSVGVVFTLSMALSEVTHGHALSTPQYKLQLKARFSDNFLYDMVSLQNGTLVASNFEELDFVNSEGSRLCQTTLGQEFKFAMSQPVVLPDNRILATSIRGYLAIIDSNCHSLLNPLIKINLGGHGRLDSLPSVYASPTKSQPDQATLVVGIGQRVYWITTDGLFTHFFYDAELNFDGSSSFVYGDGNVVISARRKKPDGWEQNTLLFFDKEGHLKSQMTLGPKLGTLELNLSKIYNNLLMIPTDDLLFFDSIFSVVKTFSPDLKNQGEGFYRTGPAVLSDGTIVVASTNMWGQSGTIYFIAPDGKIKTRIKNLEVDAAHFAVGPDDTLFFSTSVQKSETSKIVMLSKEGIELARFDTRYPEAGAPIVIAADELAVRTPVSIEIIKITK